MCIWSLADQISITHKKNNLRPLMRIISSHDNPKKKITWDKSRARKTWISWVHLNRRWHKHRKMTAPPYLKIKKKKTELCHQIQTMRNFTLHRCNNEQNIINTVLWKQTNHIKRGEKLLTLYTLISVCKFSIMFLIHFL